MQGPKTTGERQVLIAADEAQPAFIIGNDGIRTTERGTGYRSAQILNTSAKWMT